MDKAFEKGLFVMIIGPKGTGKTSLVREYAIQKLKELETIWVNNSFKISEYEKSALPLVLGPEMPQHGLGSVDKETNG